MIKNIHKKRSNNNENEEKVNHLDWTELKEIKRKEFSMILSNWLKQTIKSFVVSVQEWMSINECLPGRCVSDKHHIAFMCKNSEIILF